MNGNLWRIISGIVITVVAAGLLWASNATMTNTTDIAVLKSQYVGIKCDIQEIKDTVRDIRQDQIRREIIERKRDSR